MAAGSASPGQRPAHRGLACRSLRGPGSFRPCCPRPAIVALLVLLTWALSACFAGAAVYYVSPEGDDANQGSETAPFRTLAKPASLVNPGDTVLIKAGVYPGNVNLGRSGTAEQPIVVKAFGAGEVRISGRIEQKTGFVPTPGRPRTWEVAEHGEVAGVALDLATTWRIIEGLQAVKSLEEVDAGVLRYFYDREAGRLYVNALGAAPEPEHTIHVLRDATGISLSGAHVVVEGLTLNGFASNGVAVGNAEGSVLRRCRVSLCGFGWGGAVNLFRTGQFTVEDCMLYRAMNGILMQECTGTRLLHNTIYRTRAHGIIINRGQDTLIRNNIIYAGGVSGSALYVGQEADAGLQLDYNCYLDTGTSVLITWLPLGGRFPTFWDYRLAVKEQDRHSLSDDPLFVSTVQGQEDFRLRPESPCRGRADDGGDLGVRFAES